MSIFESLIINLIFLLFPFLIYEIYVNYSNNVKEQKLFFDLACFSSMFLIIRYSSSKDSIANLVFINFPLLIAFLKNRHTLIVLLSLITIYYYHLVLNTPIVFGIIEYSIYLVIYFYMLKKKNNHYTILNIFISIKSFLIACILYLQDINKTSIITVLYLLFIILIFIITMMSILALLEEGEKVIEKNKKLQELAKEKELKLALFKLTHEIKNPIAVCKGYLEMLDINKKEKLKKYLPIIKDEINRTLLVINDFSDYGKLKIELEEVDLVMLLEDIEDTLKPLLEENKAVIKFSIKLEELYINLDYNRMKQVLINVIKNSIEASAKNKKLIIKVSIKKLKDEVKISIEDNGIGMTEETLSKISKIFYTTKQNGTGLGVALSKEIVEQHHGSMIYKSELGKGTKVNIFLPAK